MRHPSTPTGNNNGGRVRPRGAIRTHLGRKRVGSRGRPVRNDALHGLPPATEEHADLFDRLAERAQELFAQAGELTVTAFDKAVDAACVGLVNAGEFTAENAEWLRQYVRRDLLHRTDPSITFRSGDLTSPGVLTCTTCSWKVRLTRTTILPPCPQCSETSFHKET